MKHKVLIIDDCELDTEIICRLLVSEPFEILTAKNTQVALEYIQAGNVACIISDFNVSAVTADEFIGELNVKGYPFKNKLIVVSSILPPQSMMKHIIKNNVPVFLKENIKEDNFIQQIQSCLQGKPPLSQTRV